MKNLTGTLLTIILFCFYLSQMCTDKGYISFGSWMIEQNCSCFPQMQLESKYESSFFFSVDS